MDTKRKRKEGRRGREKKEKDTEATFDNGELDALYQTEKICF